MQHPLRNCSGTRFVSLSYSLERLFDPELEKKLALKVKRQAVKKLKQLGRNPGTAH